MSRAVSDQTLKLFERRKRMMCLFLLLIVLLALTTVAPFYLTMQKDKFGVLVHWHIRQPHFGRFYLRQPTFDPHGNYIAVGRGYSLGLCDVFSVTREPPPPELINATLLVEEKGAGLVVGNDSGPDIWREVASGLDANSVTNAVPP